MQKRRETTELKKNMKIQSSKKRLRRSLKVLKKEKHNLRVSLKNKVTNRNLYKIIELERSEREKKIEEQISSMSTNLLGDNDLETKQKAY